MKELIITGIVGKTPEMKRTQDGGAFVVFSVGVNEGSGENKKTTWFNCTINEKLGAAVLQYTDKGCKILCKGSPSAYAYIDQQGKAVAQLKMTVYQVEFLTYKNKDNETNSQPNYELPESNANTQVPAAGPLNADDIPF